MKRKKIIKNLTSIVLMFFFTGCFPGNNIIWNDFKNEKFPDSTWTKISDGDFKSSDITVIKSDLSKNNKDYKLRFRVNTLDTNDEVKYLGIRSNKPIKFDGSKTNSISFDFDWNNQANGSYLSFYVYICPEETINPKKSTDWIALEYAGVPPGKNLRTSIWQKQDNILNTLFMDWGERNQDNKPIGRPIGNTIHKIIFIFDADSIKLLEDGKELFTADTVEINHNNPYFLYFQLASGTNYPDREIFIDNIAVNSNK